LIHLTEAIGMSRIHALSSKQKILSFGDQNSLNIYTNGACGKGIAHFSSYSVSFLSPKPENDAINVPSSAFISTLYPHIFLFLSLSIDE